MRQRFWQFSWLWLGWGRDLERMLDFHIWLLLFPDLSAHERSRLVKGWHFSVHWDWLPLFVWVPNPGCRFFMIDSAAWTGRTHYLHHWSWPFLLRAYRVK